MVAVPFHRPIGETPGKPSKPLDATPKKEIISRTCSHENNTWKSELKKIELLSAY